MNDYKNRYSEEPEISMIADFEGDEANLFNQKVDEELPILPLRDVVIFPGVILPVQIGRTASLKVVKYCYQNNCQLGTLTQRDAKVEDPQPKDLYETGIVARILRILEMPDGKTTAILQGQSRFTVEAFLPRPSKDDWWTARVRERKDEGFKIQNKEFSTLVETCRDMAGQLMQEISEGRTEVAFALRNINNNLFFINFCFSNNPF